MKGEDLGLSSSFSLHPSSFLDPESCFGVSVTYNCDRSLMAKKKLPKVLALLDEDMCTGCEACLVVCPVDCISTIPGITMIPTDQFLQNQNTVKQLE